MARALGLDEIRTVTQVHGDRVVVITEPAQETEQEEADAMVTDIAGIGLLIQQADCQAILLYDPVRRVIGAVHSGWRGSVANIIAKTIATMKASFSCSPTDIQAVISPSLGPCCAEFIHYKTELPESMHPFHVGGNRFDFRAISRHQLQAAGLRPEKIWSSGQCTMCNSDYFSHRRSVRQGRRATGRNGSVIALPA
jgi:YfiH family protein